MFTLTTREAYSNGHKIARLDAAGQWRMTRGNSGLRRDLLAFLAAPPPAESILVQIGEDVFMETEESTPAPPPAAAAPAAIPGQRPVPEKEPFLRPGLGPLAPEYLWWAWHQPEETFTAIYHTTKQQWQAQHGGYLAKLQGI